MSEPFTSIWSFCLQVLWPSAILLGLATGCASSSFESRPHTKKLTAVDRARMLVEIGNNALLEGDPTGALQYFSQAEEIADELPELHHSRALAYYAKRDFERATRSAERSVALKPNYSDANNTLGKLYLDQGKLEQARPYLHRATSDPLYRNAYRAWTNLGILDYRQAKFANADQDLNRAIQESPQSACIAYYYRGHIHLRANDTEAALKDYHQATKRLCANFKDAYLALGLVYERQGKTDLARKTYLDLSRRYPNTKIADQAWERLQKLP